MISIALANILKRKTYLPTTSFFLPQRNKFHDSGFFFYFFFLLLLFILFASHSICAHRRLITPVTSYWNFFSIPNFNFYRQKWVGRRSTTQIQETQFSRHCCSNFTPMRSSLLWQFFTTIRASLLLQFYHNPAVIAVTIFTSLSFKKMGELAL